MVLDGGLDEFQSIFKMGWQVMLSLLLLCLKTISTGIDFVSTVPNLGKISFDNGFVFNKLDCFCIVAISPQG